MQYDKYEARVAKIANVMKFIFKHMKKIILAISCALVITGALLGTKGIIVSAESCPEEITYGEALDYSANAFLSAVKYEYRAKDSTVWSEEAPTLPGEYYVRAAAKALFGYRYSKEEPFVLNARSVTVNISNRGVAYGDNPVLVADTAFSDVISCSEFIYNADMTKAVPKLSAIKVTNAAGEDVTSSYRFTANESDVRFEERPITISVPDKSKVYDGTELVSSEYAITSGSVAEGDKLYIFFDQSITDAGSIVNRPTYYIENAEGKRVTDFYDVSLINGNLTVTKRELTVSTESAEFVYDGNSHSKETYAVEFADGHPPLASGDKITADNFASQTDVGRTNNSFDILIRNESGKDVTDNYSVTANWGLIVVKSRPITVSTKSGEKIYDGSPLTVEELEIKGDYGLAEGQTIAGDGWASILDAGVAENTATVFIRDAEGRDVTSNYSIELEHGSLEVKKRPLSVATKDITCVYDGYLHSDSSLDESTLAEGDTFWCKFVTTVSDAGTYENIVEFDVFSSARDKVVSENYEITVSYGTINIGKRPITVITPNDEWTYDAEEHFNDCITIGGEGLADGQVYEVLEKTTVKNYTEGVDNLIAIAIFVGDNIDVSSNYEITYETGILKINKREITVHTPSAEKIYDDMYLSDYAVRVDNIVEGHFFAVISYVSIKYAGSVSNTVSDYDIFDGEGESVKENYSVIYDNGTLTVHPRPIVIATKSDSKIYDATPLTAPEWYVHEESEYGLVGNHYIFAPSPTGSITDAGTVTNGFDGEDGDVRIFCGDDDLTPNYAVRVVRGELTVEPRPITVITGDAEKVYDGTPLSNTEVSVMNIIDGHTFVVIKSTEITNVSESGAANQIIEYDILDEARSVKGNYAVSFEEGTLTITKRNITVTTKDAQKVYDATALTEPRVDTPDNIVEGHSFNVTDSTAIVNVSESGAKNRVISYEILDGEENHVEGNYQVTYVEGTLTVTKRHITVTTKDSEKMYDGTPLSALTPEAADNIVEGHTFVIIKATEITNVSESGAKNKIISYDILDYGEKSVKDNYNVSYVEGELTVTKRPVTLVTKSATKVYDATPLTAYDVIISPISANPLVLGHTVSFAEGGFTGSQTDAGSSDNIYIGEIKIYSGKSDVTDNYDVDLTYGTLTVTKRPVTAVTQTAEKEYDGLPLTAPDFASVKGLVNGHEISFKTSDFTGSQTKVGESDNTFEGEIKVFGERELTSNYEISIVCGTLTVNGGELLVTTPSDSKVYDGTPLSNADVTVSGILSGHTFEVIESSEIVNAGSIKNSVIKYDVLDEDGNSIKDFYIFRQEEGTLTVTKRAITAVTGSATKVYDGTALTAPEWFVSDYSENQLVTGHNLVFSVNKFTGAQTDVGSCSNTYGGKLKIYFGKNEVTSNYEISEELGTLTVTSRLLLVQTPGYSGVYDGRDHSLDQPLTVTVNEHSFPLCDGHEFKIKSLTPMKNVVFDAENIVEFEIVDADGNEVTENYNIPPVTNGRITITKFNLQIKTDTKELVYNGKEQRAESFTPADEEAFDNLVYGRIEYVGAPSLKNVGSVLNVFEIRIFDDEMIDVTEINYDISVEEYGTFSVIPRRITLLSGSAEKFYDGRALTFHRWQIPTESENTLVEGHTLSLAFTGSQTDVGTSANTYVNVIILEGTENVTENYDIIEQYGTLNVKYKGNDTSFSGGAMAGGGGGGGGGLMPPGTPIFLVTSEIDGTVYFKLQSYGSYNGSGFEAAAEYGYTYAGYSAAHILPLLLSSLGETGYNVTVDNVSGIYALPYYTHSEAQLSDVYTGGSMSEPYTFLCYFGDYYGGISCDSIDGLREFEAAYRDFVYANYLDIDTETLEFMQAIIEEQGFDKNDENIIAAVKNYIMISAVYNNRYDSSLNDSENTVISFLSEYKEGTSQHFAAAAAMMYRALGIPARYTVGYMKSLTANETSAVTGFDAYCWVEVYLDGIGWVVIDASGSGESTGTQMGKPILGDGGGELGGGDLGSGDPGDEEQEKTFFIITSEKDGKIYLKVQSYGSYTGKGFENAEKYLKRYGEYGAHHILPLILEHLGKTGYNVTVEALSATHALPYYTNGIVQNNDVVIITEDVYTVLCYLENYYGGISCESIEGLMEFEAEYREFVYANYLDIDAETLAFMQAVIAEQGFSKSNADIVKAVAEYISHAAAYNLEYNRALDESGNIVIAFLSEYKEGICQHYAASATMLFRALGIPARYTVGFMADAVADTAVEVTDKDAHAWVEIYLDGIGWVKVEVTGGMSSDGEMGDGSGGGSGDGDGSEEPESKDIVIKPAYLFKEYDGMPLYAENSIEPSSDVLNRLLGRGYRYEVTVDGVLYEVGMGVSTITSFILYDENDNDVTENYNVIMEDGILEMKLATIEIYLYEKKFEYDGAYHFYDNDEWFEVTDFASVGIELVINSINISIKEVSELTSETVNMNIAEYIDYSIYCNGDYRTDYADQYRLIVVDWRDSGSYVPIQVVKRQITVETESATKRYDGTPLKNSGFYVSVGLLAPGHRIYLEVTGEQTAVGKAENTVNLDSFKIYDENGNDVTENYDYTVKATGVLTVV